MTDTGHLIVYVVLRGNCLLLGQTNVGYHSETAALTSRETVAKFRNKTPL